MQLIILTSKSAACLLWLRGAFYLIFSSIGVIAIHVEEISGARNFCKFNKREFSAPRSHLRSGTSGRIESVPIAG